MNVNGSKFFFENGKIRQRKQRTKSSQHEIYVSFMEQYPDFATGSVDAHNCDMLWNELAAMLNSNGIGPVKSAKAWRLTLTNWKHQVRYKARKLEDPVNSKPQNAWGRLNRLEERALVAWGGVGVSMDRMQEPLYNCQIKVDESPPESRAGDFDDDDDDDDEDDDEGNASDHSETAPKRRKQQHDSMDADAVEPPLQSNPPQSDAHLNGNQNIINTLSALIRANEESKIHAQTKMAEAMNNLAEGLRKFAEAMNTMVEANLSQMGIMLQIVKTKPNN